MFTRSILIPSLVVCAIAAPILFSKAKQGVAPRGPQNEFAQSSSNQNLSHPWNAGGQPNNPFGSPGLQSRSANFQTAPSGNPIFLQANSPGNPARFPGAVQQSDMVLPSFPRQSPVGQSQPLQTVQNSASVDKFSNITTPRGVPFSEMTPDFGSAQTLIYPGNAEGPDFTAAPLEFMPVTNFEEIFRFDISPAWVTSRWNRVSTNPGNDGLHGLRVAVVTGTNSWDLHGSLTYYFDKNQKAQRITFRGWAGDGQMLTNLLTQKFGFKSQPTHWAGFYLAKKRRDAIGGILMQHPTVIYRDNPIEQIAVVLEINNRQGEFVLSDEFQSLIEGSKSTR